MMNKKTKQQLSDALDKALAPPRKRKPLDDLLSEYDDAAQAPASNDTNPVKEEITGVPQYRSLFRLRQGLQRISIASLMKRPIR